MYTWDNNEQLKEVVRLSWFTVDQSALIYTRVKEIRDASLHFMTINDGEEMTVVTREENLPLLGDYEANKEKWRLINIRCGNPFYCAGFIAGITSALAAAGIDIVMTSSFSCDMVLVMDGDLKRSVELLVEAGFEQRS